MTGKVAVITGASDGIGAGLVAGYRARGWAVVASARTIKPSQDPEVLAVEGDIADPASAGPGHRRSAGPVRPHRHPGQQRGRGHRQAVHRLHRRRLRVRGRGQSHRVLLADPACHRGDGGSVRRPRGQRLGNPGRGRGLRHARGAGRAGQGRPGRGHPVTGLSSTSPTASGSTPSRRASSRPRCTRRKATTGSAAGRPRWDGPARSAMSWPASCSWSPRPTSPARSCISTAAGRRPLSPRVLGRPAVLPALCQRGLQLVPGADAELGEHLGQVPFDGARGQEQLRADLRVRQAVAGQPGDLLLLRGELVARLELRLRTFSPVAISSRRARSANASIPIEVNWSWAARSWVRASTRRCSRRSHSPYTRWARASSGRSRVRPSRSIASRYRSSAAPPPLSSARQRASMPRAGSVPQGCVVTASRASASRASSASPARAAASTSSGSAQMDIHGLRVSEAACWAAAAASS